MYFAPVYSLALILPSQDDETSDSCLRHLQALPSNTMTEVYLMFYQSTLPVFTKINLVLQKDSICIHVLHDVMENLPKKLHVPERFVTVEVMDRQTALQMFALQTDRSNQLGDVELMIGFMMKQTLQKLKDAVEPCEMQKFFTGACDFCRCYNIHVNCALLPLE